MDYALSQTMTIGGTKQIPRLLLLYDIMCQWGIHAKQRFALNGLSMPKVNEILRGVGIWHVYAHVNRCFGRYAPIYLKHVGLVDGEILETLWSLLNQVSESCQTMSLASREETINFHMNDINRKKNMEMSKSHYHARTSQLLYIYNYDALSRDTDSEVAEGTEVGSTARSDPRGLE